MIKISAICCARRLLRVAAILLLFGTAAHAQLPTLGVGGGFGAASGGGGGGGGCSAAAAFLVRTSGLSATESGAYTTLICGMISDGVGCSAWSGSSGNLDALYIFATNNTTTAGFNLCGSTFGITPHGMLTFTADTGWTGDGSTGYLDTGFTPSTAGGNCTQNACSWGIYILTNRGNANAIDIGASNPGGGTEELFFTLFVNGNTYFNVNGADGSYPNGAIVSTVRGSWIATRTGATTQALYLNGNTTAAITGSNSSTSLPGYSVALDAFNNGGTVGTFSSDQIAAALIGGGLTAAQQQHVSDRINAFMAAFGVNVY